MRWKSKYPSVYVSEKMTRYIVIKVDKKYYLIDRGRFWLGYFSPYFQQKIMSDAMEIKGICTREFKILYEHINDDYEKNRNKRENWWETTIVMAAISALSGTYFVGVDLFFVSLMVVLGVVLLKIIFSIVNKKRLLKRTGIMFKPNTKMRFTFNKDWIMFHAVGIGILAISAFEGGALWIVGIFFLTFFQLWINSACLPESVWLQVDEEEDDAEIAKKKDLAWTLGG